MDLGVLLSLPLESVAVRAVIAAVVAVSVAWAVAGATGSESLTVTVTAIFDSGRKLARHVDTMSSS